MRRQELHPHTAIINRTQKIQSKKARQDALQWLAATFPKAFDNAIKIHPLKIGIMEDIFLHTEKAIEAGFSKSKLREAVVVFTRRIDYLTCLKAQEYRIDLEGNIVSQVTEEEADKAALKIRKKIEKSLRNSRKSQQRSRNISASPSFSLAQGTSFNSTQSLNPHMIERKPLYAMQDMPLLSKNQPTIKHKSARQFDPDAVARIKQRLGLSLKDKETDPVTE